MLTTQQTHTERSDLSAPRPEIETVDELLVLGLGSNQGTRKNLLRWAVDELRELFGPLAVAPLYRTAPISPIEQPDYLNTVVVARLPARRDSTPLQVLRKLKHLEHQAGRRPGARWGPRPLDIDLLLYGNLTEMWLDESAAPEQRVLGPELVVPHPRLRERRFVLAPLHDLAPNLELPPDEVRVSDLLACLGDDQRVERIEWSDSNEEPYTGSNS